MNDEGEAGNPGGDDKQALASTEQPGHSGDRETTSGKVEEKKVEENKEPKVAEKPEKKGKALDPAVLEQV